MGAYPGPRHPPRRGTRGSLCSSGCLCIHASPRPGPLPPGGRNLSPEKLSSQQPGFQYFPACLVPSPGAWHRAQPRREALTRAARTGPPSSVILSLTAVDSDCCPFRFYPGSHRSPSWCGHGVAVTHRAGPSPRSLGDAPVLGLGQSSPLSPWTSPMRLSPRSGCGTLKATTVSVLSQVQLPVHVVSCSASSQHPPPPPRGARECLFLRLPRTRPKRCGPRQPLGTRPETAISLPHWLRRPPCLEVL